LPKRWRGRDFGAKLYRFADLAGCSDWEFYHGLVSHWNQPGIVIGADGAESPVRRIMSRPSDLSYLERMMYWDLVTYLPGDILVKVDRAAMSVGLETRVPLLDHRVVEFAWSLPIHMKFRKGLGKWILRRLLDRYVPRQLVDRPKVGFGIPISAWLRGPLRDWAEAQISDSRLRQEGILDPLVIRKRWHEHLAGTHDWGYLLWDVLMFQAWLDAQSESLVARTVSVGM
jgi:asparagine synthase (glutamine-hydrolysing)